MRRFLLIIGWLCVASSIADALFTAHALWIIATVEGTSVAMTADTHMRDHLSFLYWAKDVAYAVLPRAFVDWIFGLPTLAVFGVRMVVSGGIGFWALRAAGPAP